MMGLLVFKERLRRFYAKNSQIVIPAVKFAVAFMAFYLIEKEYRLCGEAEFFADACSDGVGGGGSSLRRALSILFIHDVPSSSRSTSSPLL